VPVALPVHNRISWCPMITKRRARSKSLRNVDPLACGFCNRVLAQEPPFGRRPFGVEPVQGRSELLDCDLLGGRPGRKLDTHLPNPKTIAVEIAWTLRRVPQKSLLGLRSASRPAGST